MGVKWNVGAESRIKISARISTRPANEFGRKSRHANVESFKEKQRRERCASPIIIRGIERAGKRLMRRVKKINTLALTIVSAGVNGNRRDAQSARAARGLGM